MRKPESTEAVKFGRLGARRRMELLTPQQRSKIAKKAAVTRWKNVPTNLVGGRYKAGTATAELFNKLSDGKPWAADKLANGIPHSTNPIGRLRWLKKDGAKPPKQGQTQTWTLDHDAKRGTFTMTLKAL